MEKIMETEVQKFYRNKNVLLTGCTGFIGKVVLEKLLRVTEINCVYLIVRPKRGKDIDERINEIFKDVLYDKLHETKKDFMQKLKLIKGDCIQPQLGVNKEDRKFLIENVNIILHCAATTHMNNPLKSALPINFGATVSLLNMAKEMLMLQSFVHVSTAFANCLTQHIEERFYTEDLGINTSQISEDDIFNEQFVNNLDKDFCKKYPNSYTFTKAMAEDAVLKCENLPVCICRPAIVSSTCKDPIIGWTDNHQGPFGILFSVATGLLHIMYINHDVNAVLVPVDYCANHILVCAWRTSNLNTNLTPLIYNFATDEHNPISWKNACNLVALHGSKIPISKTIWYPFLILCKSKIYYKVARPIVNTLPYLLVKLFLAITRNKTRIINISVVEKPVKKVEYFVTHNWIFTMHNTKRLWNSLSTEDQELFNFDMLSLDWSEYIRTNLWGMRRIVAKEEPDTIPKSIKRVKRLRILHHVCKYIFFGGVVGLLYLLYNSIMFIARRKIIS